MGLCGSSQATPQDKQSQIVSQELDKKIQNSADDDKQVIKLLLLGAGESGKSTLFKQMISIYGKGFTDKDREQYLPVIHNNIVSSIKTLSKQSETRHPINPANAAHKRVIDELKGDEEVTPPLADTIAALWADPAIKQTFDDRAHFQLPDSASYFFEKVHEIGKQGYSPSEQDMLRSRARTTGIVESEFHIDKNRFKMFDVGGQRNERKKWLHCFENVTAVLFVAAISEYDQVLYEDETTNRMLEALNLFEEIANLHWFEKTSMILFLNKRDLFAEKIVKTPLNKGCFPDYNGENTFEAASEYIKKQFFDRNRSQKTVYAHLTCATDTRMVQQIFDSVRDIIIRQSLRDLAL